MHAGCKYAHSPISFWEAVSWSSARICAVKGSSMLLVLTRRLVSSWPTCTKTSN